MMQTTMSEKVKVNRGRPVTLTDSGRKKRRREVLANYAKTKISIGKEHDRWVNFKTSLNLGSHAEVAKYLLDWYESTCNKVPIDSSHMAGEGTLCAATSTPVPSKVRTQYILPPEVSDISSSEQGNKFTDSEMSGVEELVKEKNKEFGAEKDKFNTFINPFELTIEITDDNFESDQDDALDPNYEPSFNITISDANVFKADFENEEDEIDEGDDGSEGPEVDLGSSVFRVSSDEDIERFTQDNPYLVYSSQLMSLAKTYIKACSVKGCNLELKITADTIASAVYLKWICPKGHVVNTWCSQQVLNRRLHGRDLMIASALLTSGSNFQKIQMFAKCLRLLILSKCTYFRIQRTYLIPSIDEFWVDHQNGVINSFQGQDLVILGDGRMDSPGHCAQYCSYTFMENSTKKILCLITLDKRFTEKKSTNLEKACFIKGLRFLLDKGLTIKEIVTDAHVQVAAYMKREQPTIKHSFDIWHGTKKLGKKIVKVGNDRENLELLDWTKDIVNHYWYTAQISQTKDEFLKHIRIGKFPKLNTNVCL